MYTIRTAIFFSLWMMVGDFGFLLPTALLRFLTDGEIKEGVSINVLLMHFQTF